MTRQRFSPTLTTLAALLVCLLLTVAAPGQVELRNGASALHGSASNSTAPASIDFRKVKKATPEYQTIRSEGVAKGSARHALLTSKMHERIRAACREVAQTEGNDCVVKKRDVENDNGHTVTDATKAVVAAIEADADS